MKANLIQNYIQSVIYPSREKKEPEVKVITPIKVKPDFDIHRELANRTFIKPLKGHGRIVRDKITDAPAIFVKDLVYDFKALHGAMKGDANDHQLGKLNDLGMKVGGLAIASFLYSKKQTPKTKAMEFVGLGSFFASMVLWPKLAIQLPAKLIHGVNVQQQYEDNFGRKKPFYQDPQFLPWDLYSDKEIYKFGDRMGVPKDIQNRREHIQEKMRKLAIQNNTLWMLTAGVATPVMSGLICNIAEPYVQKLQDNIRNKQTDKLLTNFAKETEKAKSSNLLKAKLENFIELHKDEAIDKKFVAKLTDTIADELDPITSRGVYDDLKNLLISKDPKYTISRSSIPDMLTDMRKALEGVKLEDPMREAILPDKEALLKHFDDNGFSGKSFTKDGIQDIIESVDGLIRSNIEKYNLAAESKGLKLIDAGREDMIFSELFGGSLDKAPISKTLVTSPAAIFNFEAQKTVRAVTDVVTDLRAKVKVLNKYAYRKFSSGPEMGLPNYWNDVADSLIKILKFTPKEIEMTRLDRELMAPMLRNKIELIASNDTEYKRVYSAIVQKVAQINKVLANGEIPPKFVEQVETSYKGVARAFSDLGMVHTSEKLIGKNGIEEGSAMAVQKAFARDRLLGVKSSFARLLNTLDLYKRVATLKNLDALNGMSREMKEELVELCKTFTLQGHSRDFETKLENLRNISPNMSDFSELEVKDGKIVNKYLNKNKNINMVEAPNDYESFKRALGLVYECPYHQDSRKILESGGLLNMVDSHRKDVAHDIGDSEYFAKLQHIFHGKNNISSATSERKFWLTGIAPDELLSNVGKQAYNTKKWLKIFGTVGGVLLGVTVLSQFFFGKLKTPERSQKQG